VVWKGDAAGVVLQLSEVHSGFSITATSASIFLGEGLGLFGRLGCQTAVQIIPRGVGFVLEPIGALRPEFCKKAQLVGDQLSLWFGRNPSRIVGHSRAPNPVYDAAWGFRRSWTLVPKESRTAFRDDPEHHRSVATLATRLCAKVFGFVKRNLSGA
jgi:hypothetical protein